MAEYSLPHFFSDSKLDKGFIVGFPFRISVAFYQLNSPLTPDQNEPHALDGEKNASFTVFLVFINPMASDTETFINSLYESIGGGVDVIVGGARTVDFIRRPCIFAHAGLFNGYCFSCAASLCMHGKF